MNFCEEFPNSLLLDQYIRTVLLTILSRGPSIWYANKNRIKMQFFSPWKLIEELVQFSSLSDNLDCVYGKGKRGKWLPRWKHDGFLLRQIYINFDAFILGINCNFTAWTSIKVIYGIIIFLEAWRRICQLAKLQKSQHVELWTYFLLFYIIFLPTLY